MTAERILSTVVASVLGRADVGPDEGFFDAGGDSVLALQVVARAREAGLALTIRQVFEHQTVRALAAIATEVAAPSVSGGVDQDLLDEFEDDVPVTASEAVEWETVG